MSDSTGSLRGVRVADFSRVLAGPYATMLLADLGADVVKIEHPQGDDTRAWVPPTDSHGMSTYFASVNRNKRSTFLDIKGEGHAQALRLASTADVLVENMRPGTMSRMGLDYESLLRVNPRLIYCSISGFGDGEGATLPGYDLLVQALGGLMSITGEPDGPPLKAGVAVVDVITGLHACVGIQAALLEREQSGAGQKVTVNLLSSLISALVNQSANTVLAGSTPQRLGNAHPSIAPYESFRASDRDLVIAVGNDRQFASLSAVLSHPEWAQDRRFSTNPARVMHRTELRENVERALRKADAASWSSRLMQAGVPAGVVNTVPEAIALAESLGLTPVSILGDGAPTVSNPIGLSRTPPRYALAPPAQESMNRIVHWRERPTTTRRSPSEPEGPQ